MQQLDLNLLLDEAKKTVGSDYKVAKSIGVTAQILSDWRHGRRNAQPEDVAQIASLAGMDAAAWAMRAMVAKHEGTPKGDRLMKALGKGLLATGAAIVSSGAAATETYSNSVAYFIRCILC